MILLRMIPMMLLLVKASQGFLITKAEPGVVVVSPGEMVTLSCAVDDHYEWCKWYHPGGEFCDFEWKRSEGNITMQECALHHKLSFHGVYNDKECGITFTAQEGDTGVWKCEIEEYVTWRSRGAGRVQTAMLNVTVQAPTPPPTPPPSPTTSVTPSSTSKSVTQTSTTTTTIKSTEAATGSIKHLDTPTAATKGGEDIETPEAEPRVDELENTEAGSSSSALISVVVVLIVIVVLISGAVYYRRRRNSSPATAVYEKEARTSDDQTNMVRNSNSNITFHSGNPENSNLHEYYPPNLTYSTVTPESQA